MNKQIYPPTFIVEEKDFRNAWAKQVRNCIRDGTVIVANNKSEHPVNTKDINSIIILTGDAINQIVNKQLHKQFPSKEQHLEEYIKTFDYEYLMKYLQLPKDDIKRFKYLYIERLAHYNDGSVNQIGRLHDKLRADGINRQTQVITWNVEKDFPIVTPEGHDPPCLQRIWIRVLQEPHGASKHDMNVDNQRLMATKGKVEIHLMWRSRDLYGAWMSNIVGIIYMIMKYVLKDDYDIVKIVDFCNSLHIYESDWEYAKQIKQIAISPMVMR